MHSKIAMQRRTNNVTQVTGKPANVRHKRVQPSANRGRRTGNACGRAFNQRSGPKAGKLLGTTHNNRGCRSGNGTVNGSVVWGKTRKTMSKCAPCVAARWGGCVMGGKRGRRNLHAVCRKVWCSASTATTNRAYTATCNAATSSGVVKRGGTRVVESRSNSQV